MTTSIEMARAAKEMLADLTGLKVDTVSGVVKDDRGWHIEVELLEMHRIPDGNDMLATYEMLLSDSGDLLSYERTRRYRRDQTFEREG